MERSVSAALSFKWLGLLRTWGDHSLSQGFVWPSHPQRRMVSTANEAVYDRLHADHPVLLRSYTP